MRVTASLARVPRRPEKLHEKTCLRLPDAWPTPQGYSNDKATEAEQDSRRRFRDGEACDPSLILTAGVDPEAVQAGLLAMVTAAQ